MASRVLGRMAKELLDPRYPGGLEKMKTELGPKCFFALEPGLEGARLTSFFVEVQGPDEWSPKGDGVMKPSPYRGGFFKLTFNIPADYPTSCPTVKVETRVYHTHVDPEKNELCADTMPEMWKEKDSKDRRIFHLLEGFRELLANPQGGTSAVNAEASALLQKSPEEYEKQARASTEKYALDADDEDEGDDDDEDEDDDE